jgi:hypothetical protein
MRVRRRSWLTAFAILVAVGAAWRVTAFERSRIGPRHQFAVSEPSAFLTEALALAKAREVLALDGLDPSEWQAHPDDRTAAPDGRRDEYLSRNSLNPNRGSVQFRGPKDQVRFVSVELAGGQVVCQSSRGK